jgi:hypothetical protein
MPSISHAAFERRRGRSAGLRVRKYAPSQPCVKDQIKSKTNSNSNKAAHTFAAN